MKFNRLLNIVKTFSFITRNKTLFFFLTDACFCIRHWYVKQKTDYIIVISMSFPSAISRNLKSTNHFIRYIFGQNIFTYNLASLNIHTKKSFKSVLSFNFLCQFYISLRAFLISSCLFCEIFQSTRENDVYISVSLSYLL